MKLKQSQKGLAMVEAAIIFPVFLLLMFGIMDLGIVLYDKAVITNASREAARSGIALRNPKLTEAYVEGIARDYCRDYLLNFQAANLTVHSDPPGNSGTPLTVTIEYRYTNMVLGGLINLFPGDPFPNPLPLQASTRMINE
jgi:Flp pilus assembly protein TadG